jgi:excisionase family DNA binding protein
MLSVKDVAARLKVSLATVYNLIQDAEIECYRIGRGRGTVRVSEDQLQAYLEKARKQGGVRMPRPAQQPPGQTFKHLDGDRLLDAWRRQGVIADRPDEDSAPSSGSLNAPSAPPGS